MLPMVKCPNMKSGSRASLSNSILIANRRALFNGLFLSSSLERRESMSELRTREVEDLLNVLAGLNEPDEIFALLEDLFTIREIKDTSQRLEVARLLREGESYASIEKTTGASATTIARVSKALNYGTGGYQLALEVLKASEQ